MPLIPALINLYRNIQDPDQKKRDSAIAYYAANPDKYQQLVDSNLSDNPTMLKQIFGSDARFGGNNQASTNIVNSIQSAPLSESATVQRKAQLGSTPLNDISNASKNVPQLRGIDASTVDIPSIGQGPEALLSDQQKDIRRRFLNLPTTSEENRQNLLNTQTQGEIANQRLQGDNLKLQNKELSQKATDLIEKKSRETNTRQYLLQNGKDAYSAYINKNTPTDVRQGIFESPDLKAQFDADLESHFRQEALDLQRASVSAKHDQDFLLMQHRVNFATTVGTKYGVDPADVLNAMKLGGKLDQYTDPNFKANNDADVKLQKGAIALKNATEALPLQQIKSAYNDFQKGQDYRFKELLSGNLDDAQKQSIVNQINEDARAHFGALGINAPQWGFGKKGDTQSKVFKDKLIYLEDPGDPRLGISAPVDKNNKPNTLTDSTSNNADEGLAKRIQESIKAGNGTLAGTLADPKLPSEVRKILLQSGKK